MFSSYNGAELSMHKKISTSNKPKVTHSIKKNTLIEQSTDFWIENVRGAWWPLRGKQAVLIWFWSTYLKENSFRHESSVYSDVYSASHTIKSIFVQWVWKLQSYREFPHSQINTIIRRISLNQSWMGTQKANSVCSKRNRKKKRLKEETNKFFP